MKLTRMYHRAKLLSIGFMLALSACQIRDQVLVMPTPSPSALFLPWTFPQPSSIIQMSEFRKGYETPSSQMLSSAICVKLNGYELLEESDNGLELEDYVERSKLFVNGVEWDESALLPIVDLLGSVQEIERDPATGKVKILRSNATGPFTFCWQIELSAGLHTIEYQTHKTSGEKLLYSWTFNIE